MLDQGEQEILDQGALALVGQSEGASGSSEVIINGVRYLAPTIMRPNRMRVPKTVSRLVPAPKRWKDIADEGL